jgi:hypothetical protein
MAQVYAAEQRLGLSKKGFLRSMRETLAPQREALTAARQQLRAALPPPVAGQRIRYAPVQHTSTGPCPLPRCAMRAPV